MRVKPDNGKRILVIEDDVDIREALAELLGSEGYEVRAVCNGDEGLSLLEKGGYIPSLIFLDLMMPEKDGWEFRAEQRANSRFRGIPVVVLSADTGLKQKAAALEADDFLPKPVEVDALFQIVKRYCK